MPFVDTMQIHKALSKDDDTDESCNGMVFIPYLPSCLSPGIPDVKIFITKWQFLSKQPSCLLQLCVPFFFNVCICYLFKRNKIYVMLNPQGSILHWIQRYEISFSWDKTFVENLFDGIISDESN